MENRIPFFAICRILALKGSFKSGVSEASIPPRLMFTTEAELAWLGRSGMEYARWILANQLLVRNPPYQYDSLDQVWAGGSSGLDTTNSPLANVQHEVHPPGIGDGPHGMCVYPQPGRYSLGHTGNMR